MLYINTKLTPGKSQVIYHWDYITNKLVSEMIEVDGTGEETYIICSRDSKSYCNERPLGNLYTINRALADPTNTLGTKIVQLLSDLENFNVQIYEDRGKLTFEFPYLKEYILEHQTGYSVMTEKYYITKDSILFNITFDPDPSKPYTKEDFRRIDDQIAGVYSYLKLISTPRKTTIGLCPNCFEPISKSYLKDAPLFTHVQLDMVDTTDTNSKCEHCGKQLKYGVIHVDEPMVPLVQYLNKRGITTKFCCSGHSWVDRDIYISIQKDGKIEKELPELMTEEEEALLSFEAPEYYDNMFTIRAYETKDDMVHFDTFTQMQETYIGAMTRLFARYLKDTEILLDFNG